MANPERGTFEDYEDLKAQLAQIARKHPAGLSARYVVAFGHRWCIRVFFGKLPRHEVELRHKIDDVTKNCIYELVHDHFATPDAKVEDHGDVHPDRIRKALDEARKAKRSGTCRFVLQVLFWICTVAIGATQAYVLWRANRLADTTSALEKKVGEHEVGKLAAKTSALEKRVEKLEKQGPSGKPAGNPPVRPASVPADPNTAGDG